MNMKKNDDGYVLPFVLVVLIVMALVATTALSAALRNIKTQENFIERMQDRYQAEGAVEILRSKLMSEDTWTNFSSVTEETIQEKIAEICADIYENDDDPTPSIDHEAKKDPITGAVNHSFQVVSIYGTVQITTQIVLGGTVNGIVGSYKITNPTITYTSYEIGGVTE